MNGHKLSDEKLAATLGFKKEPEIINHVALIGAGGTGKTSLLKHFEAMGYKVFPSITREYYAKQGIANEKEYYTLPLKDRIAFQWGMREFYKQRYNEFLQQYKDVNTVTDRSLFDHLAFGIYGLGGLDGEGITLSDIYNIVQTTVCYTNQGGYTHLIYLPYPQAWMLNNAGVIDDGFRAVDHAKNFAIASMILATLTYQKFVTKELKPALITLPDSGFTIEEMFATLIQVIDTIQPDP
jgi:predicted ATPase